MPLFLCRRYCYYYRWSSRGITARAQSDCAQIEWDLIVGSHYLLLIIDALDACLPCCVSLCLDLCSIAYPSLVYPTCQREATRLYVCNAISALKAYRVRTSLVSAALRLFIRAVLKSTLLLSPRVSVAFRTLARWMLPPLRVLRAVRAILLISKPSSPHLLINKPRLTTKSRRL